MSGTPEPKNDQVAELSQQLRVLEERAQGLLAALRWSSWVRNVLFLCLLAFVVVFGILYYQLYQDITKNKLIEFQNILAEKQQELLEPVSREVFTLVEEVGPEVLQVFQKQIEADGTKYMDAFQKEREVLMADLETHLNEVVSTAYDKMLDEHEKILQAEFPELNSESNRAKLHANMEQTYDQLVRRYYIDYFHNEIERMTMAIDKFPMSEPDETKGPLAQQVLYELMEMIQMMMVEPSDPVGLAQATAAEGAPQPAAATPAPAEAGETDK